MPRHRTPQPSTHWTTPPPPITSENSTQHPNATWTAVDPNTSVVWYPNSMVSNIHMLGHWFPIAGPPNTDHMKDIPSIPIVLDIQLDNNREIFTQWKKAPQHHHRQDETVHHQYILHPSPIFPCRFFHLAKNTYTFELGFLREHNGYDSNACHLVYCPLCTPHMIKHSPAKPTLSSTRTWESISRHTMTP